MKYLLYPFNYIVKGPFKLFGDPKHALNFLLQETGPKVVCALESPHAPLTRDEKDLIKRTMGGRREQQILAKRGWRCAARLAKVSCSAADLVRIGRQTN